MTSASVVARFWAKVDRAGGGPDECWTWTGGQVKDGYGMFSVSATERYTVHRFAYELLKEPIPIGMQVDHLCRNRICCNPSHLEPVTPAENARRAAAHRPVRTHCLKGHEYSEENVLIEGGARVCRTCRTASRRRANAKWYTEKESKRRREATHCPLGHEYSPENTVVHADGIRYCRICKAAGYARQGKVLTNP